MPYWYGSLNPSGGTTADITATQASRIVHLHISDAKPMAPEAGPTA